MTNSPIWLPFANYVPVAAIAPQRPPRTISRSFFRVHKLVR